MIYGVLKAKVKTDAFIQTVEQFLKKFKKEAVKEFITFYLTDNKLCFMVDGKNGILQECLNVEIVLKEYVDNENASLVERVDNLRRLLKHLKNWKKYNIEEVYLQIKNGVWDIMID
ncbi:MAG: hypothetical protein JHC31_06035 [Sulfurihydrogenibium sp.]|nr:hypothetical protein [Sulfurihydrogenibium sp.]